MATDNNGEWIILLAHHIIHTNATAFDSKGNVMIKK